MKKMRVISIFLLVVMLMSFAGTFAMAAGDDMVLKTTASVNLRKGPGLDYGKITAVSKGREYDYSGISRYDDRGVVWHQIEYKDGYAWVSSRYSDVYNGRTQLNDNTYVRTTANVNLRQGPGSAYDRIAVASKGTKLFYLGVSVTDFNGNTWYMVSSAYGEAWLTAKYATVSTGSVVYEAYVVTTASVNMRKGPGLGYAKITSYRKDKELTYLGSNSVDSRGVTWYKVTDGKNTGWISSVYSDLIK